MRYITQSAMSTMRSVVDGSPVETGGVMVGFSEPLPTVVAAGLPGPNAIKEAARFVGDPQEDRRCLERARRIQGNGIGINGYYHLHPGSMGETSCIDHGQGLSLLKQFDDDRSLLVGIFIRPSGPPQFFLYEMCRAHPVFTPATYEVVADNDPVVLTAQRVSPAAVDVKQQGFWDTEQFQCVENPVGRAHIQQDLAALREAGWQTMVNRSRTTATAFVVAKRDRFEVRAQLPREYPLNPPRMLSLDGRAFLDLPSLRQWSSACSLIDAFTECYAILLCPCCQRRHLP